MNWNFVWIFGGLLAFTFGLYRQYPVAIDMKFMMQWIPLAVITIGCLAFIYSKGGMPLFEKGMAATGKMTAGFFPMMFWLFILMGFSIVLSSYYKVQIGEALKGQWGLVGTFLASWLSPSSQALSGFIAELWSIPTLRPKLLYSLTATPLVSWNLFLIRQMGLGWEISLWMYGVNFAIAILLMIPFHVWGKMIGG